MVVLGYDDAAGDPVPYYLHGGPRHRTRRLAGGDDGHALRLEGAPADGDRTPFDGERAADGGGRVGGGEAGGEDLSQVVLHGHILISLGHPAQDPARSLPAALEYGLVFVDLVEREAHRGVGLALAHDLH